MAADARRPPLIFNSQVLQEVLLHEPGREAVKAERGQRCGRSGRGSPLIAPRLHACVQASTPVRVCSCTSLLLLLLASCLFWPRPLLLSSSPRSRFRLPSSLPSPCSPAAGTLPRHAAPNALALQQWTTRRRRLGWAPSGRHQMAEAIAGKGSPHLPCVLPCRAPLFEEVLGSTLLPPFKIGLCSDQAEKPCRPGSASPRAHGGGLTTPR